MRSYRTALVTRRAAILIATAAALTATAATGHDTLTVLILGAITVHLAHVAHDFLCAALTTWTVYGLFNKNGDLIYVGSTNNTDRRVIEHIEDDSEPWKRQVVSCVVLRSCATEKQARRVEERRIKAMVVAVEKNKVVVIHNDLHTRPADTTRARAWRWTWMHAYRAESWLIPQIRWIANDDTVPIRPADEPDDPDFWDREPEPVDPDEAPPRVRRQPRTEATYLRTAATHPGGSMWEPSFVPLLALPPVPLSPCPPRTTPVGGAPEGQGTGDSRSGGGGGGTRLADRIRQTVSQPSVKKAARQDRQAQKAAPAGPTLTAEQQDAKRRWDEREKKRKQRATKAGEEYAKQPWPGDLPH